MSYRIKHLLRIQLNRTFAELGVKPKRMKMSEKRTQILKSTNDKNEYKFITLNNGLKALLVSDPSFADINDTTSHGCKSDSSGSEDISEDDLTDVSSCDDDDCKPICAQKSDTSESNSKKSLASEKFAAVAVCVKTGSFMDPKPVQGLAHLVEHVLTMGSEKYPKENALDDYLSSRGGYQNAHTEYEYTVYEIEVQRSHFFGALKRLAHCFIAPLLRSESIISELRPVNTEFMEALPDDDIRLEQLCNNYANDGHPFHLFAWGNTLSLKTNPEKDGIDVQKCVKDFVRNHYYSDNIYVVVQSQESIETLEKWVSELFTQIKPLVQNHEVLKPIETKYGNPFENNPNFNKLFLVESVNETDQLILMWCLPPVVDHFRTSPLDYLGTIVGHEGKGSLISFLRKEGLALELVGGHEDSGFANNKYSTIFTIGIKLTDLGDKNIDKVIGYVFEYLNIIQKVGPQEWFFDELKNIEKNRFNWMEEQSAINYVKRLAVNLLNYPIEYVLCGNKLYFDYNKPLIESYLNLLTPNNACFVRLTTNILKGVDTGVQTEPWFGTRYKICAVPQNWLTMNSDITSSGQSIRFHFPNPNPFIASDFDIKICDNNDILYPTLVLDKPRVKLWYKPENKFKLPKAMIRIHMISPHFWDSVKSAVLVDLFIEVLIQNLSEEVYDAGLAGLYWSLSQSTSGLVLSVKGFNHKLNAILQTILNKMINFTTDEKVFSDVKKHLSKSYYNSLLDPSNLNKSVRHSILCKTYYSAVDRRAVLNDIDKEMLKTFLIKYFSDFYIEALIQGNFTKDESIAIMSEIESKLKLDSQSGSLEQPKLITTQIPTGISCVRVLSLSPNNKTSSITNYYQLNEANIRLQCLLAVLSTVMDEPCFNILRTKEGLGYYVSATEYDTNGISGFGVTVNSSGKEFDCTFVEQRIENFLTKMVDIISKMKFQTFKDCVTSVIKSKKTPDLELREEFNRNWNEIISFNYCFDRLEKEIKHLEEITFDEFKEWSTHQILNSKQRKRKLSIQIVGRGKKAMAECLTIDGKAIESNEADNKIEDSEQSIKRLKIIHLKSKDLNKNEYNFIDGIVRYKKSLNIFPVHKVIE